MSQDTLISQLRAELSQALAFADPALFQQFKRTQNSLTETASQLRLSQERNLALSTKATATELERDSLGEQLEAEQYLAARRRAVQSSALTVLAAEEQVYAKSRAWNEALTRENSRKAAVVIATQDCLVFAGCLAALALSETSSAASVLNSAAAGRKVNEALLRENVACAVARAEALKEEMTQTTGALTVATREAAASAANAAQLERERCALSERVTSLQFANATLVSQCSALNARVDADSAAMAELQGLLDAALEQAATRDATAAAAAPGLVGTTSAPDAPDVTGPAVLAEDAERVAPRQQSMQAQARSPQAAPPPMPARDATVMAEGGEPSDSSPAVVVAARRRLKRVDQKTSRGGRQSSPLAPRGATASNTLGVSEDVGARCGGTPGSGGPEVMTAQLSEPELSAGRKRRSAASATSRRGGSDRTQRTSQAAISCATDAPTSSAADIDEVVPDVVATSLPAELPLEDASIPRGPEGRPQPKRRRKAKAPAEALAPPSPAAPAEAPAPEVPPPPSALPPPPPCSAAPQAAGISPAPVAAIKAPLPRRRLFNHVPLASLMAPMAAFSFPLPVSARVPVHCVLSPLTRFSAIRVQLAAALPPPANTEGGLH